MIDLVTDVLQVSGVRGALGVRLEAGGAWAMRIEGHPEAALHAVTAGGAWLTVGADRPRELGEGDVVLVPAGTTHVLGSAPGRIARPLDPAAVERARENGEAVALGTPPARTRIVTMHYTCDHESRTQVLEALPDLIHIRAGRDAPGLDDTVRLVGRELAHPQFATTAVLNSLVDIMLVQLVRAWLPTRPAGEHGTWLGVLEDPLVHRAVQHLHARPARPWTTASLAAATSVSRATLSRRFTGAIGLAPAAYLTRWRLDLAASRLRALTRSA